MEGIINWAKGIIYYVLFIKIIMCLVPNGKMNKYIKLISSILLIIILIKPILSLKEMDEKILYDIIDVQAGMGQDYLKQEAITYNEMNNQLAVNLYKERINSQIEQIVFQEGAYCKSIKIHINEDSNSIDYGNILMIDLKVSKYKEDQKQGIEIENIEIKTEEREVNEGSLSSEEIILKRNIKSALIDFYNLSSDNIYISIE